MSHVGSANEGATIAAEAVIMGGIVDRNRKMAATATAILLLGLYTRRGFKNLGEKQSHCTFDHP